MSNLKQDFTASSKSSLRRYFAASTLAVSGLMLGGCATMNSTTSDCVARTGFNVMGLVASVKDTYDTNCALARSAQVIASMTRPDGTRDVQAMALALNIYNESNPNVRKHLDRFLHEEGMTAKELEDFVVAQQSRQAPLACEVHDDGQGQTYTRCAPTFTLPY